MVLKFSGKNLKKQQQQQNNKDSLSNLITIARIVYEFTVLS